MRIASQTTAQYRMTPLQNQSMLFLYSGFSELSFLENSLYYFPEMDAVAIASVKEDTLAVYDVLSSKKVPLNHIKMCIRDRVSLACISIFIFSKKLLRVLIYHQYILFASFDLKQIFYGFFPFLYRNHKFV